MIEQIQRRATKIIPEMIYLSYEESLKEYVVAILETRSLRGDQIDFLKILIKYIFFSLKKDNRTRGQS